MKNSIKESIKKVEDSFKNIETKSKEKLLEVSNYTKNHENFYTIEAYNVTIRIPKLFINTLNKNQNIKITEGTFSADYLKLIQG